MSGANARVTSMMTRPADTTAYAAGDLVANSTTAGSVVPLTFSLASTAGACGQIVKAKLYKQSASLTNASFRLHLFRALPSVTNGDNGILLMTGAAGYMGSIPITCDMAFSDGSVGIGLPSDGGPVMVFETSAGSTMVYGFLEAMAAYTPTSQEQFAVTLEVIKD